MGESKPTVGASAIDDRPNRPPADAEALVEVVRRDGARLLAVATRLAGSREAGCDALQEAFLLAHRNLAQFDGRASLSTWVHRIVINAALMGVRKRQRLQEVSVDDLMPEFDDRDCRLEPGGPAPTSIEVLLERVETLDLVRGAVSQLPPDYQQIVVLRDFEGITTADAAERLGITTGAAKVRLHRARAALKRLLEPLMERRPCP